MPKIPQIKSQVRAVVPNVQTNTVLSTPKEAFGGASAAASERLGQSVVNAGKALSELAAQKMKQREEKEALDKELGFKRKMNDALYSNEIETYEDEDGNKIQRPKGFLNRKLGQTKNLTDDFLRMFNDELYDEETNGISDYQRSLLHPSLAATRDSALASVVQHQAREDRKDYQETFNAAIDEMLTEAASYERPKDLDGAIDRMSELVNTGMRSMGADDKTIASRMRNAVGKLADNNISALLEKNPDKAEATFEAVKNKLPADTREMLAAKIADKQFTMQRSAVWDVLSPEHKQPDGSYDLSAFRDEINELPNYNAQQKDQLFNYMEGRAREQEQALKKSQAANYSNFMIDIITGKKQGLSYDQQAAKVNKYAANPLERYKMERDLAKLYDTTKTDPELYTALYQQLKTGELTETQLENARNKLSGNDYETFRKGIVDQIVNPKNNAAYRETFASLNVALDRKYGSNKQKKDDFLTALYVEHERAGGGSPDQLYQTGLDLLEKVKTNKWIPFIKKPKFEVSADRIKEDSAFKAGLETDLGRELVQYIGRSMMIEKGNKTFNADDLREFVDKFGGYDKIQPGTQAYKAIKLLQDNKMLITPATVETIIDRMNKR